MTAQQLRDQLAAAVARHRERETDPDALGLVLTGPRSPGPTLGIRCERLGPAPNGNGTAWGVRVGSLAKALRTVNAAIAAEGQRE